MAGLSSQPPPPSRLSDIEIQRALGTLPGWARRGDAIVRTYYFATFPAGVDFIAQVAKIAESMQHHPDIDIRYTKVLFILSTHDVGGVSAKDLELARRIEELVEPPEVTPAV